MEIFWNAIAEAVGLLFGGDAGTFEIIGLSLRVSGVSLLLAMAIAIPAGYVIGSRRFPGRGLIIALVNTGMGLPPVVVGLVVYMLISRSGPVYDAYLSLTGGIMPRMLVHRAGDGDGAGHHLHADRDWGDACRSRVCSRRASPAGAIAGRVPTSRGGAHHQRGALGRDGGDRGRLRRHHLGGRRRKYGRRQHRGTDARDDHRDPTGDRSGAISGSRSVSDSS